MKRKKTIRVQKSIRIRKPTRGEAKWKKWKKRLRTAGLALSGIGAVVIVILTRGKIKIKG